MEKRQFLLLLPLPVQCKETTSLLLSPPVTSCHLLLHSIPKARSETPLPTPLSAHTAATSLLSGSFATLVSCYFFLSFVFNLNLWILVISPSNIVFKLENPQISVGASPSVCLNSFIQLGLYLTPRAGDALGWCMVMLLKPRVNFLSRWRSLAGLGAWLLPVPCLRIALAIIPGSTWD